jgi:hypothetical protein
VDEQAIKQLTVGMRKSGAKPLWLFLIFAESCLIVILTES